ncbi:flagellar hook-length control protein FliK [Anaerocolumna xylanovorans]|uniref:Flagellar hook-length control protein FliK n=1 Tax=Anaerocolumna xylanovorans DSM 12503 TaxID=1121345 RepID=A0A1M7YBG8_9FIRM|nr:flagellar hook-length control protein FliK [Anaerocolumna xylanovorans]SHO49868.1 flagellar hook-length control protein FliK [Anaerocolumna xylanovorans DSM 12503]
MMQNVKAGFVDNYTAAAGSMRSQGTAKSSNKSFEDVITSSLKASKPDNTGSTDAAKTANSTDANKAAQDVKTKQGDSQAKPGAAEATAGGKADNTKDTDNTSQAVSQLQDKDAVQKENVITDLTENKVTDISNINIKDLLDAIKNGIKQKLGISEDDLNKALESLGFTPLSLLDVNNLKQFLLKVSNNDDMSAFLTNEDLGNTLKELMKVCDTIQEQFPVSKEQLPVLTQPVTTAENKTFKDIQADTDTDAKTAVQPDDEINITVVKSVKSTDTHSSEGSKSDKQKTEQNLSATELLIHNLAVNSGGEEAIFTNQLSKVQQIREITSQILDAVRINIKPDQTSMELQLNPENLGKINLTVVSKEGVLTARFVTGTETAKEAIESQLQVFKENLNNQGLKVENVEVTVSYSAFDQKEQGFQESSKDNQEKGRNRAFRSLDEINGSLTDTSKEELTNLGSLEQSTNSVDYTA